VQTCKRVGFQKLRYSRIVGAQIDPAGVPTPQHAPSRKRGALGQSDLSVVLGPQLADLLAKSGGQRPLVTRVLVSWGEFLASYWWVILLVTGGVLAGFRAAIAPPRGRLWWDRAKLRQADLRGSNLAGLNLAVLADYAGVKISDSEQSEILKQLGVDVCVS